MDTIRFVDTTIRDGHQSLWAENLTTGIMLPIAEKLDNAGKKDPWERVRLMSKLITKTPLRLIAGRVNTFVKKRGHSEFLRSGVGHGVGLDTSTIFAMKVGPDPKPQTLLFAAA